MSDNWFNGKAYRRTHRSQKYSEATEGEQKEYAEKKAGFIKLSKPRNPKKPSGRQSQPKLSKKVSHPSLDKWFKEKFGGL